MKDLNQWFRKKGKRNFIYSEKHGGERKGKTNHLTSRERRSGERRVLDRLGNLPNLGLEVTRAQVPKSSLYSTNVLGEKELLIH